jgi:hypothetical protein
MFLHQLKGEMRPTVDGFFERMGSIVVGGVDAHVMAKRL